MKMGLMDMNSLVLALDRAGNPNAWLNAEAAVHLIATDRASIRAGFTAVSMQRAASARASKSRASC